MVWPTGMFDNGFPPVVPTDASMDVAAQPLPDTDGRMGVFECARRSWSSVMALPYVYGNFAWTGMDYKVNPAPKTPQNISPRLLKHVFGDLLPLLCPHARMRAHTHHPPPLPTNKKGGQAGHRKLKNAVSLRLSMAVLSFSLSLPLPPP